MRITGEAESMEEGSQQIAGLIRGVADGVAYIVIVANQEGLAIMQTSMPDEIVVGVLEGLAASKKPGASIVSPGGGGKIILPN